MISNVENKYYIMKIKDIINEDINRLRQDVITQIQTTDDEMLLNRIFTVLNQTGLTERISSILHRDTDTKNYLNMLTQLIIQTEGTYEEKNAFVVGYPKGYINVPAMISGNMVTFDELITGIPGTPIEFVKRVFYALAGSQNDKGPGELALAVLSPLIAISGRGDLKIGKMEVEVKGVSPTGTGGGRMGEAGGKDIPYEQNPAILMKYTGKDYSAANAHVSDIPKILAEIEDPKQRLQCATELFTYIFRGKVNVTAMAQQAANGQSVIPQFFAANYEVYKQRHGFDSLMILDFKLGRLRNYTDPMVMINDIGLPNPYITGVHVDRGSIPQLTFSKKAKK